MTRPAVLYAATDSIYKTLDCDVWDIERDARTFPGGQPVVAHPPCRAWGILRRMPNVRDDDAYLALEAVLQVEENGGVLEHPVGSRLWARCHLGYFVTVAQSWWGHRAEKWTRLYIVGVNRSHVPPIPFRLDAIERTISTSIRRSSGRKRQEMPKSERAKTPVLFAEWLLELASRAEV